MDGQLKQRMVGAAVLIALGVIFIPVLLDESGRNQTLQPIPDIPEQPTLPESIAINTTPIALQGSTKPKPADIKKPADNASKVISGVDTGDLTAWVVQLGSFGEQNNASKLVKELQNGGFNAFIEQVKSDGKVSHRVRIGPEMTQKKADQIRQRVSKKYSRDGVVMRYSGPESN